MMLRPTTTGRQRAAALALGLTLALGTLAAPAAARPVRPAQTQPTTTEPVGEDPSSAELKAEYDEVIGREAELLTTLLRAQQARKTASDKLTALANDTKIKQLELLGATDRLKRAEKLVADRIAARKAAAAQVRAARERLRRQIVASYVTGGDQGGKLEAFLNATNGEQVGQALAYGHAVSTSTNTLVKELKAAETSRTKAAKAANRAQQQAKQSRDDIAAAAQFLLAARDQQQKLVADMNVRVLAETVALREVQGRKALIDGRINAMNHASDGVAQALNEIQADQPDWVPGSVVTSSPISGVKVSSPYGPRFHPILHITRLHAGCDLGSPTGTEIHALADGVVVFAEVRGGYGNAVVIDHGNSLASLYGHTSKMLVDPGQQVRRGEVIALVGSTGLSTGPHLHFETRIKGLPIDPESVVDFNAPVDYDALDAAAAAAGFGN